MADRYQGYERLKFDYPDERILRITISRPERFNALDAVGHRELTYVWREVDDDPDIDCVVLTGEGRAFSAGGDFDMIERNMNDYTSLVGTWKEARDLVYNVIDCGKPTISSINGPAVGAGLVAALLCDVSIAARSVFITDGHTRLGVAAGDHAAIVWPLLCGMAKAKYYLLTCDRLPAEEAERIGLISLCVDDGELGERTMEVARKLARGAPERHPLDEVRAEQLAAARRSDLRRVDSAGDAGFPGAGEQGRAGRPAREARAGFPARIAGLISDAC